MVAWSKVFKVHSGKVRYDTCPYLGMGKTAHEVGLALGGLGST